MWRLAVCMLLLVQQIAWAQNAQPVQTQPAPASTAGGNASSTITSTNTFQQVFAAAGPSVSGAGTTPGRKGCTIENNGTHNMWVTEALSVAASTTALAVVLQPTQVYSCETVAGIALQGQINITGTSGDSFYAAQY